MSKNKNEENKISRLPIYASSTHDLKKCGDFNKGLLFERFFDQYDAKYGVIESDKDKGKAVFLKKFNGFCGNKNIIENMFHRQVGLVDAIGGEYRCYKLTDHFVTGMGNSHPVENGFLWHYNLGTPYLSGSMIKGLVRALIEEFFDSKKLEDKKCLLLKWFGSEDKDPIKCDKSQAGELIFFDAIPITTPHLVTDIMTPHMGEWYAQGGEIKDVKESDNIPADWHNPVPIPFLVVEDATFLFSIAKRAGSDIDLAEVFDCLDKALQYLGAGAKTQTGYGYMKEASHPWIDKLNNEKKAILAQKEKDRQNEELRNKLTEFHYNLIEKYDLQEMIKKTSTDFDKVKYDLLIDLQNNLNEKEAIKDALEIVYYFYADKMKNPKSLKKKSKDGKMDQRSFILGMLELERGI